MTVDELGRIEVAALPPFSRSVDQLPQCRGAKAEREVATRQVR
jgi:hypothetical protein